MLPSGDASGTRLRWAQACAGLAMWCLGALTLSIPKGLLPFGVLLLLTTALVPVRVAAGARRLGMPAAAVAAAVALAMGVPLVSSWMLGLEPGEVESLDRLLVLPWTMAWAYVLAPSSEWLWRGSLCGLAVAAVLAVLQVADGAGRASGWGNAIVFADVVLLLTVLAVFCRPPGRWRWAVCGLVLGTLAILLSGTRGTWPGLLMLLAVLVLGSGWRSRRSRLLLLGATVAGVAALVTAVPGMSERTRLQELQRDIERIDHGDHNSSAGARLERLRVAGRAFLEHPWTGVGFAHFDRAMERLPECRRTPAPERCHLGHAHNDLAEWAATMGLPGALALLALYGVPLALFVRLWWRAPRPPNPRGVALAGAVFVAAFASCGLTQSMFAHQTTTSFYAAVTGLLLGMAMREAATRAQHRQA